MRVLPKLGQEIVGQIEEAWKLPQEDWARKRLLVVRLIAQHEHTVAEIMKIAAVCRQTVFTYRDKVLTEGVQGLLKRDWNGARKPAVRGAVAEEFLERLVEGKFRQARDAQTWIKKRTRKTLTESGVRKAVELAANLETLSDLRAGFRERMLASDITNGLVFAQRMGESLSLLCK